ncbi:barstar family protein [Salinispira pacifica]|uniref:barstar family protein n=1 Tax=Salinispira pacifica TaxID=1307761 RepID=UPI0006A6D3B3|nr:barstar family protein [Salinispira pacifica]
MYEEIKKAIGRDPWINTINFSKDAFFSTLYRINQESNDFGVYWLFGHKMQTKKDFYNVFSASLQFPDYFNDNWDSFEECMFDLEWLKYKSRVIGIVESDKILTQETYCEREIFFDVLKSIISNYNSSFREISKKSTFFNIFLQCESLSMGEQIFPRIIL